jgi:hypothetical protein
VTPLRRVIAAVIAVGLVAGGVILDRTDTATDAAGQDEQVIARPAGGSPPQALTSTFVCPGGQVNADAAIADLTIHLLDVDGQPSTVTLTALTADGPPVALPTVTLVAGVPASVRVADSVTNAWVSVVADVEGSGVVIE